MGYQIGNQCVDKKVEAENHYFSQVIPTITADGKLLQPTYQTTQGWFYQGKKLEISLPKCDPVQNFKDGMELGFLCMVIAIILWSGNKIIQILERTK